jgi:biotin synthase
VLDGQRLDRPDLLRLAALAAEHTEELLRWAGRVRQAYFGGEVGLCGIVPGRLGGCSEDCRWCAQSTLSRAEPMPARRVATCEIVEAARQAHAGQTRRLGIVNAGRRPTCADLDALAEAIDAITADDQCGAAVCASLGEIDAGQARRLREMGVRRYHHNLEAAPQVFARLVTTHSFEDRLATIDAARQAGMEICCGGLLGLGETWADRVELALILRDRVKPDCVPLNFLHPIPGTPLAGATPLTPLECLASIAIFRLTMPTTDITIAGGRLVNLRDLQSWIFAAGASSLMTGQYLTTAGRESGADLQMIRDLGLSVREGEPEA